MSEAFRSWLVERDGQVHVVQLAVPSWLRFHPRTFTADGTPYSLGGVVHRGPRAARFEVGGHLAELTMRSLQPTWRIRLRRSFGSIWRGAAFGGGAAAAAAGASRLVWSIYELSIDNHSRGYWVLTDIGGSFKWTHVLPGGALPNPRWPEWPRPQS